MWLPHPILPSGPTHCHTRYSTYTVSGVTIQTLANTGVGREECVHVHDCRRKRHLAELTYKCNKSLAPSYLSSLFCLPTHHHNTRTKTLVNLPMVRTTFGQHAFAYTGASLWRSLPSSLRESGSPEEFSRAAYYYFDSLASQ